MEQNLVSVVIPALNEAEAIGDVVRNIRDRLPQVELLVVNDGSSDATAAVAEKAGARVVSHDHPRGYGAALSSGVREASREYVLFCDGDGQHSAADVARLIDVADGYDMVVGKRGADSHRQLSRRPGKMILRWFADYLAGEKIPDLNSGLRIFRCDVLKRFLHLMPTGFSFSTTSTFAMLKTGQRIKWVPITVAPRVGKSTVRQFQHGMQTILLMVRLTVLFEPLKVFLNVAGWLLLLSVVMFSADMAKTYFNPKAGGISDTTVILSIATLLVFLFGLLCDQVSAIRRERCL